eukprot:TRINITY_DN2121_c0_g5_i1.p1 TRINITY_DN2121_c0_g5~~TRINITY_DN2121_c0_g5_i1.p1  ORF type:complete len:335 (-),score=35.98 TRINITY_DN2121_c0_g5_i1:204-1058(-)
MVDSPFGELNLQELGQNLGVLRVRQHVNPLKIELQGPVSAIPWNEVYDDPTRELWIDIGSGYGRFLMLLNRREEAAKTQRNYLGLEIRKPVVDRANKWAALVGAQGKVWFELVNATKSLKDIVKDYPGKISTISIQFPDPHVKRRHHKRRIVQPELTYQIAEILPENGSLFLQTDVLEVAIDMRDQFEEHVGHLFQHSKLHFSSQNQQQQKQQLNNINCDENVQQNLCWKELSWLDVNPIGVPTEREVYVLDNGEPVYRIMLDRNGVKFCMKEIQKLEDVLLEE